LKKLYIITDLLDPTKGSEFRTALKPLILLKDDSFFKEKITLFIPKRKNNIENVMAWLKSHKLKNVLVKEYIFKYQDEKGNHKNKFYLILDLIAFYKYSRQSIRESDKNKYLIFKCGQINWFFYFIFLLIFRKRTNEEILCAPVSGFNYVKLKDCYYLPLKSKIYYFIYNFIIFIARKIFKYFFVVNNSSYHFLFATYSDSKVFFQNNYKKKTYSEIEMFDIISISNSQSDFRQNNQSWFFPHSSTLTLLWSGHLVHRKNPILAIEIITKLLQLNNQIEVYFIGNGPLYSSCLQLIIKNKLYENSRFKFIPNLPRIFFINLINNVNAVFITSIREVNSIFFLESLYANKKIIAFKNSGMKDFDLDNVELIDISEHKKVNKLAEIICQKLLNKNTGDQNSRRFLRSRYLSEKENLFNLLKTI